MSLNDSMGIWSGIETCSCWGCDIRTNESTKSVWWRIKTGIDSFLAVPFLMVKKKNPSNTLCLSLYCHSVLLFCHAPQNTQSFGINFWTPWKTQTIHWTFQNENFNTDISVIWWLCVNVFPSLLHRVFSTTNGTGAHTSASRALWLLCNPLANYKTLVWIQPSSCCADFGGAAARTWQPYWLQCWQSVLL